MNNIVEIPSPEGSVDELIKYLQENRDNIQGVVGTLEIYNEDSELDTSYKPFWTFNNRHIHLMAVQLLNKEFLEGLANDG